MSAPLTIQPASPPTRIDDRPPAIDRCRRCGGPIVGHGAQGKRFCRDCFRELYGPLDARHTAAPAAIPAGWQCPCCLAVHAPGVRTCECQMSARAYTRTDSLQSSDIFPIHAPDCPAAWGRSNERTPEQ